MVDWEYLVSLDIGGIHDYIFGTNKLREIRGASVLLDKLNCKTAVAEITRGTYGVEDEDWRRIVTGGGNIKILFAGKARAEEYKASISGKFREMATGAKFAVIISERENGEPEDKWIQKAERELQREKGLPKENNQLATSSFFKACQACGLHPAEKEDIRPEGIRYICKSCHQKVDESAKYREADIYKRLIEKVKLEPRFPSEFSEIGEQSKPQGYIGFIYADANRMGEHLVKIKTFDELKKFSKDVEEATLDATVTAITNHFKEKFFPLQIILAGGDDLILALPAHKAIDVAMDFCEEFNKGMSSDGITTSASVVICHDTLPIRNILHAAESLLKNAKAESRERGSGSYIDFIVVTGSTLEDPVSKRKRELEIPDSSIHSITKRPYSLEEMGKFIKAIRELKEVDFPRNKLRMLYDSLFKGHYQSILDACYIKTRLEGRYEEIMKELIRQFQLAMFPWEKIGTNQYATPFGDIVELYEFIH
ncbi:hypothetical protein M1O20_00930 [Dehalococcoidia bacterium]|nr:hypothetical protein [Dehalococcoidia bacterium]